MARRVPYWGIMRLLRAPPLVFAVIDAIFVEFLARRRLDQCAIPREYLSSSIDIRYLRRVDLLKTLVGHKDSDRLDRVGYFNRHPKANGHLAIIRHTGLAGRNQRHFDRSYHRAISYHVDVLHFKHRGAGAGDCSHLRRQSQHDFAADFVSKRDISCLILGKVQSLRNSAMRPLLVGSRR
jgi:hypothetical protein